MAEMTVKLNLDCKNRRLMGGIQSMGHYLQKVFSTFSFTLAHFYDSVLTLFFLGCSKGRFITDKTHFIYTASSKATLKQHLFMYSTKYDYGSYFNAKMQLILAVILWILVHFSIRP